MRTDSRASVVVPTYDRIDSLAACLTALQGQTLPVEVIVVHDGEAAADEVGALCERFGARLVRVPHGGVAAARNAGAATATCEYVLLTDDDCEPAPDWAQLLVQALDGGATVAAGGVLNAVANDHLGIATQAIHDHVIDDPLEPFVTPNNVACTRAALEAVPFDPAFRRAGEDRDWCARLTDAGIAFTRVPEAVVLHRQDLTLRSFLRKHVGYGKGSAQFRAHNHRRRPGRAWYAKLLRRGFRHGVRAGTLVAVAQVAGAYGALRRARRSHR